MNAVNFGACPCLTSAEPAVLLVGGRWNEFRGVKWAERKLEACRRVGGRQLGRMVRMSWVAGARTKRQWSLGPARGEKCWGRYED